MEQTQIITKLKKKILKSILIFLLINSLIDVSIRIYINYYIQNQHVKEITELIQEAGGEVIGIEAWTEGSKRSFWYTKLNSFRMYIINYTKNGDEQRAIYSYSEGYLLDSFMGRHVNGKWYIAPE